MDEDDKLNPRIDRGFLTGRSISNHRALPKEETNAEVVIRGELGEDFPGLSTKDKIKAIARVYGDDEAKRFLYKTVNTLLNDGFSSIEIAHNLGITPTEVRKVRTKLKTLMSTDLQAAQPNDFIAERISFYNSLKETAQRAVRKYASNPHVQKHFIDLALRAEADMHRLLQVVGFYDYKKFDPGTSGYAAANDASDIKQVIEMIAKGENYEAMITEEKEEEDFDIN